MRETEIVVRQPHITWGDHPGQAFASRPNVGWELNVITTEKEFDALEREWDSLVAQSSCSVFQTFAWARTWWKHFGSTSHQSQLHIVVLYNNGDVVAIAPFFSDVTSVLGLAKMTRLCFIGRTISDYLDVIIRDGMQEAAYPRLAEYLSQNRNLWDIIFLEDIPHTSATRDCLLECLSSKGIEGSPEITEQCPRIALPATWEDYHSRHSHQFQRELRRKEMHLREQFYATFETISDRDLLDEAFTEFIALHQERWHRSGEIGVFAEAVNCDFHREAIPTLFAKKLVRLNFLKINGRRVAGSYNFVFGSELSMYLLGVGNAGEAQKYSPGLLLTCYTIRQAIAEGKTTLDFMRGGEEYKYKLLAESKPNWTLTMYTRAGKAAAKAERNRNLNIFFESSRRRAAKELTRLHSTIKHNGILSHKTLAYLASRPSLIFHDAKKKVGAPLKPLYIK